MSNRLSKQKIFCLKIFLKIVFKNSFFKFLKPFLFFEFFLFL